jgi:conjugal transfer pilin signal peptidase TrbI
MIVRQCDRQFLTARKEKVFFLKAAAFVIVFISLFYFFTTNWSFAYTRKNHFCFPYKAWFIQKKVPPTVNDFASFKSNGIPNFDDGVKWIKLIIATEGDRIEVQRISDKDIAEGIEKYIDIAYVNDMPIKMQVRGLVRIYRQGNKTPIELKAYEKDTKGRTLPIIEPQVIPKGKYFVFSPAKRSYDSRYWGLVDESWIIGKAHPLF